MMINRVILEGRLGADPVRYQTASNKVYTFLSVPLFDPFQKDRSTSEWMQCQVWGKSAEYMLENAKKGMVVSLEGRLRNRKITNAQGETTYRTYIAVERANLIRERRSEPTPPPNSKQVETPVPTNNQTSEVPKTTNEQNPGTQSTPPAIDLDFDPFA